MKPKITVTIHTKKPVRGLTKGAKHIMAVFAGENKDLKRCYESLVSDVCELVADGFITIGDKK